MRASLAFESRISFSARADAVRRVCLIVAGEAGFQGMSSCAGSRLRESLRDSVVKKDLKLKPIQRSRGSLLSSKEVLLGVWGLPERTLC